MEFLNKALHHIPNVRYHFHVFFLPVLDIFRLQHTATVLKPGFPASHKTSHTHT